MSYGVFTYGNKGLYDGMLMYHNGVMSRGDRINIRCSDKEKEAFSEIADLLGLQLSVWVRMALRKEAESELRSRNRPVPFVAKKRKARKDAGTAGDKPTTDPSDIDKTS